MVFDVGGDGRRKKRMIACGKIEEDCQCQIGLVLQVT